MVELLEVMPLEENMAPPEGAAAPPEAAAPAVSGKGGGKGAAAAAAAAADGRREKRLQQRAAEARRQNGLLAALLVAAAVSRLLGLEGSPPMSAHQAMHRLQSQLVEQALHLDMEDAAVEEGLFKLGTKAGAPNPNPVPNPNPNPNQRGRDGGRAQPRCGWEAPQLLGRCRKRSPLRRCSSRCYECSRPCDGAKVHQWRHGERGGMGAARRGA